MCVINKSWTVISERRRRNSNLTILADKPVAKSTNKTDWQIPSIFVSFPCFSLSLLTKTNYNWLLWDLLGSRWNERVKFSKRLRIPTERRWSTWQCWTRDLLEQILLVVSAGGPELRIAGFQTTWTQRLIPFGIMTLLFPFLPLV